MKPDISVIMSVYNGEVYLAEAIESVRKQTFKNWEFIIINDCSTDSTDEILADFSSKDKRIKVYKNEVNLRLPASLNKAVSLCSGKYIARMDADDICLPDRLEKQYKFMEENCETAVSSCRFLILKNGVFAPGASRRRNDDQALRAMLLVTNPVLHPGVIAKAEVMKKFPYDSSFTCTEDLELWTRMVIEDYKIQLLPEYLIIYRLHDKQITSTTFERQCSEVLKIQQKYYSALLCEMDEKMQRFYIRGIYFREDPDIDGYIEYAKWLRSITAKNFDKSAVNYALLEILAEYKRCGVRKSHVFKGLLGFSPCFLVREFIRRKIAYREENKKLFELVKNLGLEQLPGTNNMPLFKKR